MRGKGKFTGHSQSGTCSERKTLKRCKNNGEADNVVVIDIDSDNINNVIIIDVPESLKQKLQGSSVLRKDKMSQIQTIICIDDDESSDNTHPGTGVESSGDFYSDASSSGRSFPASNYTRNSVDAVGDECQFVQENLSPLKLSKCKRTYSGKASRRNWYGLGPESASGSYDDDYPDCEFMEDSFGKLREQWEKANIKRKNDIHNGQSGRGDQATPSGLQAGIQKKVEVENMTDQHTQAQVCPSSSNASYEEETRSPCVPTGVKKSSSTSHNPKKTPFADFGWKWTKETQFSDSKADNWVRVESFSVDLPFSNAEGQTTKHVKHGGSSLCDKEGHYSQDKVKPVPEEPSFFSVPYNEAHTELKEEARELSGQFMSDQQEEKKGPLHAQDGDVMNTVQSCIINEREKLKESDEYKRAVEEEWASRQQELQRQAEEAQMLRRLRKRKKAESMRLLDMERRQKQRVEEMREIQKKDEENMNLKEQLRAEVRKELNQLEITCQDMASLLRGLGIHLGDGFQPLPQEVRAAYKRALLSFHPDRASGSDIRQLVEAEEKFKLISRMKEKFLLTSS